MAYMRWINGYDFHMFRKAMHTEHRNQEICVIMNPESVAIEMNYLDVKKRREQVKQRIVSAFKDINKKNWEKIEISLEKFVADVEDKWGRG